MKDVIINTGAVTLVLLPIICLTGLILNYFAVLPDGINQLWFLIPMVAEGVFVVSVGFMFAAISITTGKAN